MPRESWQSLTEPNPIPLHAHTNTAFGCAQGCTPDAQTPNILPSLRQC